MSWRAVAAAVTLAAAAAATLAATPPPPHGASTPSWNPKLEWPLTSLHADVLWHRTVGTGVTIAIVDTGIDTSRPDLIGTVVDTINLSGGTSTDVSDDSHGTAVAGLIAGRGRSQMTGLAPRASLIDIKVAAETDSVTPGKIAEGITEAADDRAEIINVSVGTRRDAQALRQAIAFAEDQGCLIVAAAGDAGTPQYPADDPGVISVSAISQKGLPVSRAEPGHSTPVSLYAPGADLFSTGKTGSANHGYRHDIRGNAYAAAYVSAAAALLLSTGTPLGPEQAGHLLVTTTKPVAGSIPGPGILDPVAALSHLTPALAPASTPPAPASTLPVTHLATHGHQSGLPVLLVLLAGIAISLVLVVGFIAIMWVITSRKREPAAWPPPGQVPGQQPHEPASWDQTW